MPSKTFLKGSLRWVVALTLLFWLFKSGKLASLSDLRNLTDSPWLCVFAVVGFIINYVLNFFRWQILLHGVDVDISFSEIVRLSMIGQFFSIFMPGAVGGDLIKAVYVAKEFPAHRTVGVASILLDRVLGFLTLLLFATIFFLLSFDLRAITPGLQSFALFLILGTGGLLLAVLLPGRAASLLHSLNIPHPFAQRIVRTLRTLARSPRTLLLALAVSFVGQAGCIAGYYLIGRALYGALPWAEMDLLRFISGTAVGTTASAIPVAPMGLGVGQVAFGKVFKLLGAPDEAHGIVIISAAQIILFVLNLLGALWFLKSKKKHPS